MARMQGGEGERGDSSWAGEESKRKNEQKERRLTAQCVWANLSGNCGGRREVLLVETAGRKSSCGNLCPPACNRNIVEVA